MISRRRFLALSAGTALLPLFPSFVGCLHAAEMPSKLAVAGPPAPLTMPLARLGKQPGVTELVPTIDVKQWRNPDIMRTWIVSGEVSVVATPANAAAILYNKNVPVRLLDVNNGGILSVLSTDTAVTSFKSLKGKTIVVFYRGDIPDVITRYLLQKEGLNPDTDVTFSYVDSPFEALQMFLSKRADTVLLPEPAATAALMKGKSQGLAINQIVLQEIWERVTGRSSYIPLGATICQAALANDHPQLIQAITTAIGANVSWINAHPAEAAKEFAELFSLKAPVLQKSLERFPIRRTPAVEARKDLEFYYSALMEMSPKLVGGKLPDSAFYLG
ncbi:ABC transporter substrate-binding protein [Desulfovibrio inopinatus]|uniref:ABC transporter substrate-binding protein n=1 Tax=Desulfovibrio inopinatus TaxID=102109 RepID=UPI0003FA021A|nr:ABC transporter substrate-binding protein [Desulfovibrio inopinatus]